jgi:ABC-2 type transport system permease protein
MLLEVVILIAVDTAFIGICLLLLMPLSIYKKAAFAVVKRDFVGYFMNPTGYIFLCIFVLLTSLAAFWPHEFFNANLANLDQLNRFLPYIMLIFIPAITMSMWSEERRQGTDELLLTLPAADFDIVVGKYCSAAAIYTCSLIFSQLSHYVVLVTLTQGLLDQGLLCATYFGYWLTGLAMIAIGMIASFWTRNLTVGFILGVLLNAPLAFAANANTIIPNDIMSRAVEAWSISAMFDDFGRGVVSLASFVYFVGIIGLGLYISMILIATRHWFGGKDSIARIGHYIVRIGAAVVTIGAITYFLTNHDLRFDATEENVSSLSADTIAILKQLDPDHPVEIEAFISRSVPEANIQTQHNLKSMLKEFASYSTNIRVQLHDDLQPFSKELQIAEERFGIKPRKLQSRSRGVFKTESVIMGAAFTCGMEKVVVPFFEYGVPVEYELIRSINTVQKASRPRLGVVRTDAFILGDQIPTPQGIRQIPRELFLVELEKQYDIDVVNPLAPIVRDRYAALIVVQPSSLSPVGMTNLIDAVNAGIPTAIFEDPFPVEMAGRIQATGEQRVSLTQQVGVPAKGDIRDLWDALGINAPGALSGPGGFQPDVVWQIFNPYPGLSELALPFQIFVSANAPESVEPLNRSSPITRGLTEVFFPFPGCIGPKARNQSTTVVPLATTSKVSGTMTATKLSRLLQESADPRIRIKDHVEKELDRPDSFEYWIAAHIKATDAKDGEEQSKINAIYVADVDFLATPFLQQRANPRDATEDVSAYRFENVTFLLNIIDELTGDDAYMAIRGHTPRHFTLRRIEAEIELARSNEVKQRNEFMQQYEDALGQASDKIAEAQREIEKKLADLKKRDEVDIGRQRDLEFVRDTQQVVARERLAKEEKKLAQKRDEAITAIRRDADLQVLAIQNQFKIFAAVLPPIPPLIVGLLVFIRRRLREREGISRERLL